jgi:SOS-response transcriptional repressor LexA
MFIVLNLLDLPSLSDYPYPLSMPPENIVDLELNGGTAQFSWAQALLKRRVVDLGKPSQERIVAAAGDLITQTDISRLERGLLHPIDDLSVSQLNAYIKALQWTIDEFIKETGLSVPWYGTSNIATVEDAPNIPTRSIPLFDGIGAGPGFDDGNRVGEVDIPLTWDGLYGAYVVHGNSMAPDIPDGTTVIAKITETVELGDIVVVFHPDHGMIVKQLLISNERERKAVFSSKNPDYAKILCCDGCRIIGKVRRVERIRDYF